MDCAREIADRFLESGLIVSTAGRKTDEKKWYAMRDGTYPNFPLAVLVNGSSASAAEILAGSLRDNKRAVVVGERTYGKGSVQEVVELDRQSGAIKLTTALWYTPSGRSINRKHLTPDDDSAGAIAKRPPPTYKTDAGRTVLGGTVHGVMREAAADVVVLIDRGLVWPPARLLVPFAGTGQDQTAVRLAARMKHAS